jgi:signal transduction histidine kinase
MTDEKGAVKKWIGVNVDIEEERRASAILEEKVRERTSRLRGTLDSVEELLYAIAHELRAPNRAMQGFAQLLAEEYGGKLDETAKAYLNRISGAAVRADNMICNLLEYGRLLHEPMRLGPVDVKEVVSAVLVSIKPEIENRRAHVRLGSEWPHVIANEEMLKRIVYNLMNNAVKYVPPDREPDIAISAERRSGVAVLKIQDNGVGIPPEQIDDLFRPFTRLPGASRVPGLGLGLASVKKAAERMNARVGVESALNQGACFWLELQAA